MRNDTPMMPDTSHLDELLEPSLASGPAAGISIYSARAALFISFFGGPIAALAIGGLNARLLQRLRQDAWVLVFLAGAFLAFVALVIWSLNSDGQLHWFGIVLNQQDVRSLTKGVGLVFYALIYLRHRRFHRAMDLGGSKPRKPWVMAGVVIAGALALHAAILFGMLWVRLWN
jgi:hypothetical protein